MTSATAMPHFAVEETARRLEQSLVDLEWALSLLPAELCGRRPRAMRVGEETWSAAMNLAHMLLYEERLPAPILEDIAAGGTGVLRVDYFASEGQLLEETRRTSEGPMERLLERLRQARARQAAAVRSLSEERLNAPLCTLWGPGLGVPAHPAGWIAAKTFQHTWEHGTTIQQLALFAPAFFAG
jgi:hypothetical protein